MFEVEKRRFTIILWGISLVNLVKLTSPENGGLTNVPYFFFIIILMSVMIYLLIKKYQVTRFCKPNIFVLIIMGFYNYFFIKIFFEQNLDYNFIMIAYSSLILLLFDLSLFVEIRD